MFVCMLMISMFVCASAYICTCLCVIILCVCVCVCVFLCVCMHGGALGADGSVGGGGGEEGVEGVDPGHVIPLKRQQGFLNMVGQMITILGPKLLPHLPDVVTIVATLGAACAQLLENRHMVRREGEREGVIGAFCFQTHLFHHRSSLILSMP